MPKRSNYKVTKEQFLEKLYENNGNAYKTYTDLKIPYNMYYDWRKTDPDFNAKVEKSREKATEFVENKLWQAIEKGDPKMIKFYLSTVGGYAEKKKVEISSGDTIDINAAIESIKSDLSE